MELKLVMVDKDLKNLQEAIKQYGENNKKAKCWSDGILGLINYQAEKQIKTKKRVRDYGEVFTAEKEVKAMKIIVGKMPRYFYVDEDCIFAELTGKQIGGKDYSYFY